ncbi:hypothetical protein ACHWQZ_G010775 [Mnemiopsis leidyi]
MMTALQDFQLDDVSNGKFSFCNVSQVITASECVFRDMHKELNLGDFTRIRQSHFNKRTVPKEKLAEWLETDCHILDSFSIPLLKNAMSNMDSIKKQVDDLQEEKINDQKEIIQLKDKIIEKKSDELNKVTSTVKTEMKSFSTIVKKNCHATLTKKTIEAAEKSARDKDDRSKNIIIYGIEESSDEVLRDKVENVLQEINEKPVVRDCVRVGFHRSGDQRPRPVKFSLSNSDHVAQVLRSANRLHTKEGYKSVYICPDRTVQERRTYKILLVQLKEKRKSEPNRTHYIRNNRIVSSDMNSSLSG